VPAPFSPCPHCAAPVDEVQRYCLACGAPCNEESARLLALAAGTAGPTSDSSLPPGDSELSLVAPDDAEGTTAAAKPLRQDRRAVTSIALAAVGFVLLMITGWGPDTAQTLASALPPGLSVTYPTSPALVASAADALAGDDAAVDDAPVDDVVVDDTVVADVPVDDAVVDDTTTEDAPADTPEDTPPQETAEDPVPPPIKHVYVVVVPGQDVAAAAQTPEAAPYLAKTLAPKGTILSGYRGVAAGGLPNTVALISGQGPTPEIVSGCPAYADLKPGTIGDDAQELGAGCAFSVQTGTVGDQLASNGGTWRAYTPDPAGTGCVNVETSARQAAPAGAAVATPANPFASFHTATDSADCPKLLANLDALDADLAAGDEAPALSYVQGPATPAAPATAADPTATADPATPGTTTTPAPDPSSPTAGPPSGTDVGLAAADAWLGTVVPKILASKAYADGGLLVVTSDATAVNGADDPACCRPKTYPNLKASGGEGGRVGALLVSPYVAKGQVVDTSASHYTLLRSIEDVFALAPLGYAGLKSAGSLFPDVIQPAKP